MPNLNVIIAFAADHLREEADKNAASDNVDELSKLNQRVHSGDELFKVWAESHGGRAIAIGNGDGRIEVTADHLQELPQLKDQYKQAVGSSCSIGVGSKLSEAEKAMSYSQKRGGDSIELYTQELEDDLNSMEEPEQDEQVFNSFFDKAEKEVPLNQEGRGAGMQGPSQPGGPATDKPTPEGSEHSENESLRSLIDDQPQQDISGQFSKLAEQSEQNEQSEQPQQPEQGQEQDEGDLRSSVVEVLKEFKAQSPLWEELKQSQPDAYKTLAATMQAMVELARKAFLDESEPDSKPEEEVKKAESLAPLTPALHDKVEPFLTNLKALPKEGASRGKFITQHMNHPPFLAALQAHPQGKQVHSMLTSFMNSKANAGIGTASKVMVKALAKALKSLVEMRKAALEAGKTGRHNVLLPVGSQLDPSPSASRHVGKIKIKSITTGKEKWRSVRANLVMSPSGEPTSSRRPKGDT